MDALLASHLPRFSSSPPQVFLPPPQPEAFDDEPSMTMLDFEPELEIVAEERVTMTVTDYEARLSEAGDVVRRELEAEHAALLEAAEGRHAEALAAAVAAAEAVRDAEQGAAIAAQIVAALEAMREAVSHDIAQVLRPLLEEAVVARTIDAAASALATAIADPDRPSLKVCGPASLLTAIEAALGTLEGVEYAITDDHEVTVNANAIHIETRLAQALTDLAVGDA